MRVNAAVCSQSVQFFPGRTGRCLVMGIVNVTPDSFADGGRYLDNEQAVAHAATLVDEGADILDIGGESTRPGAAAVPLQQELDRVIPVIERLTGDFDVPVSIDTSKPEVMRAAVSAGARLINDVCALQADGALQAAAELGVPVCLMHMQGKPRTMQQAPDYTDVTREVMEFLQARATAAQQAGVAAEHIIVDPGFGFGKTLDHNLRLFRDLPRLAGFGYPLLVGVSRKSMIGAMTGRDVDARLSGSLALAMLAAQSGAAIIRVHDVAPTVDVLTILAELDARRDGDLNGKADGKTIFRYGWNSRSGRRRADDRGIRAASG